MTGERGARGGGELAVGTLVVVILAVAGVPLGVLWQWVTPGAVAVMTADGPVHADPGSERYFADDGWFAVIGAAVGVLAALACWLLARRHRGPVLLVGVVAGSLVAALVAWQVGRHIGLAAFRELLEQAPVGRRFPRPARLSAYGALAVPGLTAAFTYTLLAGWSRHPGLEPSAGHSTPQPQGAGGSPPGRPVVWVSDGDPPRPVPGPRP